MYNTILNEIKRNEKEKDKWIGIQQRGKTVNHLALSFRNQLLIPLGFIYMPKIFFLMSSSDKCMKLYNHPDNS